MAGGRRAGTLPEWKLDRIVKLRDEEQLGFNFIAERLGMSASAVSAAYQRRKGPPVTDKKILPPEPVARAYRAGASLHRIAVAAGATEWAVLRALREAGQERRANVNAHGVASPSAVKAALERFREEM
jgi:hypothetical protein